VPCLSTDRGGLTPACDRISTKRELQASNERARGSARIDPVPVTASTLAGGHRSGSHRSVGAATTAATHLLRRDMTEREHSALICAWLEGWVACGDEGRPARPADQRKMPR